MAIHENFAFIELDSDRHCYESKLVFHFITHKLKPNTKSYSTVTDLARLRGQSTLQPLSTARW